MAVGQSDARYYMALRLLYQEPKVKRGRVQNKEDVIMDWTLLIIVTPTALLGGLAVYLNLKSATLKPKSHAQE
jgi:hypothetical protein